ncbi:MAG: hypothetical protein JW878_07890 [Methanomicrobia archaeon]|nr:hypothetical protein [Methanomicrobia archaeon]
MKRRNVNYKKKRISAVLVAILAVLLLLTVLSSGVVAGKLSLAVNKTVYDPVNETWAKELTANMDDTVQFKCTIRNLEEGNLTQIRFWDIMDCSLNYSDGATINGYTIPLDGNYVFKPKMLHPYTDWNLTTPIGEEFSEFCLEDGTSWQIVAWNDTFDVGNVSACDQVLLDDGECDSQYWFHVDRVPYTLTLYNATTCETKYFDSVLDWDDPEMDLTDPNGTEWLEVCCCKDTYTLLNWTDDGSSGLDYGDQVTMRNERTQEVVAYEVYGVATDLVVSHEYEMDDYFTNFILEPGETITINYSATVVRCGVDNNTFRAKGWGGECEQMWSYSNKDKVTITVPCVPSGEATDPAGLSKEVYTAGEPVYAVGSGFDANENVSIYIVPFQQLNDGVAINTRGIIVGPINVTTDGNGDIGPELVWPNPVPGRYLMIFDDPDGDYNQDRDPLDEFSVVGAAPVVTPLGLVVLIGLLSVVATSTLLRRKKR